MSPSRVIYVSPLTEYGDFDGLALGDPVVLQVDDAAGGHLDGAEHSHHLQNPVIEAGQQETVLLPPPAPEVGPAHETVAQDQASNIR